MGRARPYRDPTKADGRNLRKGIREYLKQNYPELKPRFTIRAKVDKTYKDSPSAIFEVVFDQNHPDSMQVVQDAASWVHNEWWPLNKQKASTIIKVWDKEAGMMIPQDVPVFEVNVTYGYLHERRQHYV